MTTVKLNTVTPASQNSCMCEKSHQQTEWHICCFVYITDTLSRRLSNSNYRRQG